MSKGRGTWKTVAIVLPTLVGVLGQILYQEVKSRWAASCPVEYSKATSSIRVPDTLSEKDVRTVLRTGKCADAVFSVQMANRSRSLVKKVEARLLVQGAILTVTTNPRAQASSPYVKVAVPVFRAGDSEVHLTLNELAEGGSASVAVYYNRTLGSKEKDVAEVVADGREAVETLAASRVGIWSWDFWRIPLFVLLVTYLVAISYSLVAFLWRNPSRRADYWQLARSAVRVAFLVELFRPTRDAVAAADDRGGNPSEENAPRSSVGAPALDGSTGRTDAAISRTAFRQTSYLAAPRLVTAKSLGSRALGASAILQARSGALGAWVFVPRQGSIREGQSARYVLAHCTHGGVMQDTPRGRQYFNVFAIRIHKKRWQAWVANGKGEAEYLSINDGPHTDGWHHFLLRWDRQRGKADWFLDGRLVQSAGKFTKCWPETFNTRFYIGSWVSDTAKHFAETTLAGIVAVDGFPNEEWIRANAASITQPPPGTLRGTEFAIIQGEWDLTYSTPEGKSVGEKAKITPAGVYSASGQPKFRLKFIAYEADAKLLRFEKRSEKAGFHNCEVLVVGDQEMRGRREREPDGTESLVYVRRS